MSKAFTKEDDEGGFVAPPSASSLAVPAGPLRLTATGARAIGAAVAAGTAPADLADVLARAEILPPARSPERAALGVTVVVRDEAGEERRLRLVTAEEHALVGEGCSMQSPLGRALLGTTPGEVREVAKPSGVEELEVVALVGEDDDAQSVDMSMTKR